MRKTKYNVIIKALSILVSCPTILYSKKKFNLIVRAEKVIVTITSVYQSGSRDSISLCPVHTVSHVYRFNYVSGAEIRYVTHTRDEAMEDCLKHSSSFRHDLLHCNSSVFQMRD